jgi:hypothetical protein
LFDARASKENERKRTSEREREEELLREVIEKTIASRPLSLARRRFSAECKQWQRRREGDGLSFSISQK